MTEAWVLVDSDGDVVWATADTTQEGVTTRLEELQQHPITKEYLESWGYTFQKVVLLPEGCKVCRLTEIEATDSRMGTAWLWEPIEEAK